MRPIPALRISLLSGLLLFGCAEVKGRIDEPGRHLQGAQYVTFGSAVLCLSTDQRCLRQHFDRLLGQNKRKHYFESGPPVRMTVLPTGDVRSEWMVGDSGDRIVITYDRDEVARQWQYQAAWGVLQNQSATANSNDPRRSENPALFPSQPRR